MAISSTTIRSDFTGDGSTVTFAIPARGAIISSSTEVKVYLRDETTANAVTETLQTITTHYTISGSNVVMVTAPASDEKLIIILIIAYTQTLDLADNSTLVPTQIEQQLDRIVAHIQQLDERADRSLSWPQTEQFSAQPEIDPAGHAEEVIGLNTAGTQLAWYSADDLFDMATGSFSAQKTNTFTNGQAATDLTDVTILSTSYTSCWLIAEIVRDTTTVNHAALGLWRLQYANGAWAIEESLQNGSAHGVTLTISGTTTAQVRLASSTIGGASHVGRIKTKLLRFSA